MSVPDYLSSTVGLLRRAFPDGIGDADYMATLSLLYPHLADENLAKVVSHLTGKPVGIVTNDIYAAAARGVDREDLERVGQLLGVAGFDSWSKET